MTGDVVCIGDRDDRCKGESGMLVVVGLSLSCRRWWPRIFGGGMYRWSMMVGVDHGNTGEAGGGVVCGGVSRSEGSCAAAAQGVPEVWGVSRSEGNCAAAAQGVACV